MTQTPQFPRLIRSSAAAEASKLIREMILSGQLKPGDRLPSERELSEQLGISRPTVRESIRSLVAMNILESRHGTGTFVASLNTGQLLGPLQFVLRLAERAIENLFEARLLLEPPLATFAAERATDKEIEALKECIKHTCDRFDRHEELLELDVSLHRLIAEASHNELLVTMLDGISTLGVESRSLTVELPGVAEQTANDHARIVDAIIARDPERAGSAMYEHLRSVAKAAESAAGDGRRRLSGDPRRGW